MSAGDQWFAKDSDPAAGKAMEVQEDLKQGFTMVSRNRE